MHDISGTLRIQPFCCYLHTYWLRLLFDLHLRPLMLGTLGLMFLKRPSPTRVLHRLECLCGVHRLLLRVIFGSIEGRLLPGLGRSSIWLYLLLLGIWRFLGCTTLVRWVAERALEVRGTVRVPTPWVERIRRDTLSWRMRLLVSCVLNR